MADETASQIEALRAELEEFAKLKAEAEKQVRDLRERERPMDGIFFAKEIFEAQQEKLRLEVELQTRQNRLNRLTMDC